MHIPWMHDQATNSPDETSIDAAGPRPGESGRVKASAVASSSGEWVLQDASAGARAINPLRLGHDMQ